MKIKCHDHVFIHFEQAGMIGNQDIGGLFNGVLDPAEV